MSIAESLLPEFDQEMATTRRLLERVPGDKGAWDGGRGLVRGAQAPVQVDDIPVERRP